MIRKIAYVLVFLLIVFLGLSPFFIKVNVVCKSQYGDCPGEIVDQLKGLNGKSLMRARSKTSEYLKNNLTVSDFSTQFKVPNVLGVTILTKKPEFAVLDKSSGKVGLIDKDGKIISVLAVSSLPTVVVASENLQVGKIVSTEEFFALKLMQGIWLMYQIRSGEIKDNSLVVELPGSVTVILPLEGDLELLLGETRLVYGRVESPEIQGKYSQIDLRFKNPVLR